MHPSIHMHALYMHMIGGLVYICGSRLELKLKIDDPLDAFAVHDHVESGMNMSPFLALS
jgi:ammonia channel protein AmtB